MSSPLLNLFNVRDKKNFMKNFYKILIKTLIERIKMMSYQIIMMTCN